MEVTETAQQAIHSLVKAIMRCSTSALALGLLTPAVQAAKHQIIIGTFSTSFLYTVEFDDETNTLSLLKNSTAATAHQWLSLSHDKKNLYGSAGSSVMQIDSYTLGDSTGTDIIHNGTVVSGECATMSVHVEALQAEPYGVYAVAYGTGGNCGGVVGVDTQGVAVESVQNYTYDNTASSLHGIGFHPNGDFLYTADKGASSVWTHRIDRATGEVSFVANSSHEGGLRHVNAHPSGGYAYGMTEDTSTVVLLAIDDSTGAAAVVEGGAYGILPGNATGTHRGETARLSATAAVLYATTRANYSDAASTDGYVSAFTLDAAGRIVSQDFIQATTTGGGSSSGASNMVVPALHDDDLFAILDHGVGFIEMWRRGADGKSASVIAHLDIDDDGGCCSNGVWLS